MTWILSMPARMGMLTRMRTELVLWAIGLLSPGSMGDLLTISVGAARREREKMQKKVKMLELTIYGLVGLTAMLVIAFCFAYADEFSPAREKSSFDLINNAHLNDFQTIETGTGRPRLRGTVGKHG
jgi:hypothetical protein